MLCCVWSIVTAPADVIMAARRFIKLPFLLLCWILDVVYDGRPIQRFWVLETVARIPYFSFIRSSSNCRANYLRHLLLFAQMLSARFGAPYREAAHASAVSAVTL